MSPIFIAEFWSPYVKGIYRDHKKLSQNIAKQKDDRLSLRIQKSEVCSRDEEG